MKGILILLYCMLMMAFPLAAQGTSESPGGSASTSSTIAASERTGMSGTPTNFETLVSSLGWENLELEHRIDSPDAPVVYMTTDITPDALMAVYQSLGRVPSGNVAVKLSTGEAGNNNYLSPDLIKGLVQSVKGTIVECNTAYGGSRAETAMHRQVAADHGFAAIADVDIMDEHGSLSIPVAGGTYLTEDLVGEHLADYDFVMVLSHFKGHSQGGFGGALKNISIGVASSEGKNIIHTAGTTNRPWIPFDNFRFMAIDSEDHDHFIMSMAEAAKAVWDYEGHGERMLFISVMNHLSVDCDCVGNPAEPDMHDIGILASLDPVALDQACVDLVYASPDGASLIERIESRNGTLVLDHAEEMGFGSRSYRLVSVGD